jgi:hypothetical protein
MASPTRRVLSPLNVNSPIARGSGDNSVTKPQTLGDKSSLRLLDVNPAAARSAGDANTRDTNSITEPQTLGETLSLQTSLTSQMPSKIQGQALVGSEKRDFDNDEDGVSILSTGAPRKRSKASVGREGGLRIGGRTGVSGYGVQDVVQDDAADARGGRDGGVCLLIRSEREEILGSMDGLC